MPRVSVLLTSYNHIQYLPSALDSIRAQTYTDREIIAIDDGSSDGSRDYLSSQQGVHCIFNANNLGTYASLNVALAKARGEFVAILNDDDLWATTKLAEQVELMDVHSDVALCHTGGHFINGEGVTTPGNPLGFAWPTFTTGDGLYPLIFENKIIASAALARTQVLRDLGSFNPDYFGSGDWDMWLRVARQHSLGYVPTELTSYRVHGANASHKLDRIWKDDVRLRTAMRDVIRTSSAEGRFSANEAKLAQSFNEAALGTVSMLTGDTAGSRQCYIRSLKADPTRWKSAARYLLTFAGPKTFRRFL